MSVATAAKEAGCHAETIRRAIRNKELLATKDPVGRGRGYRIERADLASFLMKRTTAN